MHLQYPMTTPISSNLLKIHNYFLLFDLAYQLLFRKNKIKKGAKMNKQPKTTDLCINCVHLETCTFVSNQSKPIIYCEEFLFDVFQEQLGSKAIENRFSVQKIGGGELCINCDNRKNCTLVKTANGPIYCEEYR